MATNVQFITTVFLKNNTSINANVDDSLLSPFILKAQKKYLMDLIGSNFYNHLCNTYEDGSITQTDYDFIVDYVQDMVAEWTHYLAYPHIAVKTNNKGAVEEYSTYSNSADMAKMKIARNEIMDMAQFYSQRIVNHLRLNPELYPAWSSPTTTEELPKGSRGYSNNVYIPRRKGGRGYCDDGSQYR